ncbi:hypothetical protein VP1G_01119 [Cytospora mali]|uniref:3-oxoacyl-[acyl-carrier-protein] reductase n=1 Tax=Cytospora mali TaxID=578113 RepID=A0A194UQ69_CYTMA|nr:hypothetical protein VP1G_01119 [Valsa mali var. pyri (nom. inval.)]
MPGNDLSAHSRNNDGCKRLYEGKLAIVTGLARSIGAAIVRNLASKGCNIIINSATPASDERAAKLASELEGDHGVWAVTVRADISKTPECEKIIEAANKQKIRRLAVSKLTSSTTTPQSCTLAPWKPSSRASSGTSTP